MVLFQTIFYKLPKVEIGLLYRIQIEECNSINSCLPLYAFDKTELGSFASKSLKDAGPNPLPNAVNACYILYILCMKEHKKSIYIII